MMVHREPAYLQQVLLAAGYSTANARLIPVAEEQREVYDVILTMEPDARVNPAPQPPEAPT